MMVAVTHNNHVYKCTTVCWQQEAFFRSIIILSFVSSLACLTLQVFLYGSDAQ